MTLVGPLAQPDLVALILLLAILGSAFFSGCETGLMTASRVRLQRRAARGDRRVAALRGLRENLDDAILTCLVGTNLCNVLASSVATAVLLAALGEQGEWVAVLAASLVLVVFGEILPKILYREYPEQLSLRSVTLLRASRVVFSPLRWPLGAYAHLLRRLQGPAVDAVPGLDRRTVASLLAAAEPATRERTFQATMERFLRLSSTHVAEVMQPLARVVSLPPGVTLREALDIAARSGFSRLPVRGTGGVFAGYLLVRDLLLAGETLADDQPVPLDLLRSLHLVDAGLSPYELFEDLHAVGAQFAAVVDRAGRALGIVTLEDLIERVTGAIADEFDQPEERPA